ncbi:MAG: hypothetical protein IH936_05075 [Acidobacteria bacterium]|nr:hypothetical protein [Acidobacteriota bacterium]
MNRVPASLAAGLLAFGTALAIATGVSADRDGAAFFAEVRKAYAQRPSYSDLGEIEITQEIDGLEASQLHFFETSAIRGAGLVWRVMMASDRGFEDRAIWLTGEAVMIYDGGLRQAKPAPSMAAALDDVLGAAAGRAVLVPTLLEFGTSSEALDALASSASLGSPEPCFEDRECRLVSAPLPGGGVIRLTVETGTFWVHDVEVVVPGELETTTVRFSHSESSFDDANPTDPETRVAFSPPPSRREVSDWDVRDGDVTGASTFDPSDLDVGFFDVITVDVFTVVARIVDGSGRRLPDVEPGDLIATIGGREFPVTAVDWHGTAPTTSDQRELEQREIEPLPPPALGARAESEPEGRLVVIFLQSDFEPTRVKGHMKLFPGLLRLVDNLGPADRVAVLSFFAHLKLWQDFTTDRAAVRASLERAFFPGAKPGHVEPSGAPSLLEFFDQQAARNVASSSEAMQYTAEALAPLPGEKDIIFLGYGLEGGRLSSMLRALHSARATTLIVDTTQADAHTLSASLTAMARATGGTYNSSYVFANQALHRIERMLTGHYVITIDRSAMPEARGKLGLRLRDRRGTILMTPRDLS